MSTTAVPSAPAPTKGQPSEGVTLRSGAELTVADVDRLARERPATLIVLAGPPDSGKTTLLSSLYELLRIAGIPPLWFAGSRSLVAFEQRSHLARVASNLMQPETERTKYSEDQVFYHIRTRSAEPPHTATDLYLLDVAGEGFKELRTTHDACQRLDSLARADFLTVLLDGKRLREQKTRYSAVEECINFLQCVFDSKALAANCHVQVVFTKADQLPAGADKDLLPAMGGQMRQRLASRFPNLEFVTVAARPASPSKLSNAYGLAGLFTSWTVPRNATQAPEPAPSPILNERESEAFARRQANHDS